LNPIERIAAIPLTIALLVSLAAPRVRAAVEVAKSADAFVDSMGVNTHFGNSIYVGGNAYADRNIDAKLGALGIRHIRDHSWNDEALTIVDNLYTTYGERANLILGETTRSPADLVNLLKAHAGYEGIEGLNEPDFNTRSYNGFTDNPSTHDFSATRAFQNDLYAAVKADPLTQSRMILSPAMGTSSNSQYLPPVSFDYAAMHSYPSGREPTFNLDTNINGMATLRGSPAMPLMATETGYYNLPAAQTGSIPENISAKYLPRLFGEYFNRGIVRTYLYELADQGPDTTQREQNFGLLHFDLSEKPAYTALKRTIDLVEDPGSSFTPGSLDYTLTSSSNISNVHHTLLQKADGRFYLLLWQEVASYNRTSEVEISNPDLSVTLTVSGDFATAKTYFPNDSALPQNVFANPHAINLSVPDRLLIVELTPAPEPALGMIFVIAPLLLLRRRRVAPTALTVRAPSSA
jgi:hypothetical protein